MDLNKYSSQTAAQPGLAVSVIKNLRVVTPPIYEQQVIVTYLDEKISQINSSIREIEKDLTDLKSYKSSIISEAVTGKIDLRDWNKETA